MGNDVSSISASRVIVNGRLVGGDAARDLVSTELELDLTRIATLEIRCDDVANVTVVGGSEPNRDESSASTSKLTVRARASVGKPTVRGRRAVMTFPCVAGTLRVAKGARVTVDAAHASVELRGELGDVEVRNMSGNVRCLARIESGASVAIRSMSGSIMLAYPCSGSINTMSGSIALPAGCNVDASTLSGIARVARHVAGSPHAITARTMSGNVLQAAEAAATVTRLELTDAETAAAAAAAAAESTPPVELPPAKRSKCGSTAEGEGGRKAR